MAQSTVLCIKLVDNKNAGFYQFHFINQTKTLSVIAFLVIFLFDLIFKKRNNCIIYMYGIT